MTGTVGRTMERSKPGSMIRLMIFLLLALSAGHFTFAAEPSFDCDQASQNVEYVICQSDQLATEDTKLARRYKKVMEKLPQDARDDFKTEQLDWLAVRNRECNLTQKAAQQCLLERYLTRNEELAAMLAFDSSARPDNDELKILRITPKGDDVAPGQQIVFQFDRPVVPIGQMERDSKDVPVTIKPQLACEWRWLNTSALACQLRQQDKMQLATHYDVEMQPGINTLDGVQLKEAVTHSFTTARPKVTYLRFVNWLSPGTPLIQISFNQPVTKASVENTLTMTAGQMVEGQAEGNQPVNIIAYPDNLPRELPWWMALTNETEQPNVDDQLNQIKEDEARRVWVVEPKRELPLNQSIRLDIVPGLASSEGSETGIERRTLLNFETYPEFKFLGLRCTLKGTNTSLSISPSQLKQWQEDPSTIQQCAPLNPVALEFSSPVVNSIVKNHVDFAPRLDGGRTDYDPWENTQDWTYLGSPYQSGRTYLVWLPELLKAFQKYSVNIDTEQLQDEFGRRLQNQEDASFDFYTGHREPNLRMSHHVAVLEKGVESEVPVYITNLDKVTVSYDKIESGPDGIVTGQNLQGDFPVNQAQDISYAVPMDVRSLLGGETGVLYGRLHPTPTPPNWYRDPSILAAVTPYQVHFKAGHFNSLAWVTRFDNGEPVADADVSLWKGSYENLPGLEDLHTSAVTDQDGLAVLPGLSQIDPNLELIWGGHRAEYPGFFARVEQDNDIAVMPLTGDFSVRGGGIYPYIQQKGGHTHAWGTTAQGVYKLGDNIQFKVYVREQSNQHWVSPRKDGYQLQVFDPQYKMVHEAKNITLNEFGAFDGEFKVPEQGAVGWYQFQLSPVKDTDSAQQNFTWSPMSVLVSDFTPAPFKVKNELNGHLFKAGDQVEVTTLATLHSGGPFTEAEVRLTARLSEKTFTTDTPRAQGFTFGSGSESSGYKNNLLDLRNKLDDKGQYVDAFTLPDSGIYFGTLMVESAVKDDRGKFISASTRADYAGRDRFVGLRNTNWLYKKGETATLETLVVDQAGQLVSGVDINIVINHREYKASRVKGPGNAYLTKNIMAWVEETGCRLKSAVEASLCQFKPKHPGYYQFVATIKDTSQREHSTTLYGWVTGSGNVVWDQSNDATLQIVAEQTDYKIGDTARYLIKNPFPGAKALVTVERYGVLDRWVQTLDSSTPVIEIPVKPDYLPGFYLSMVVVSPRVEQPLGPGQVDLGKPSYRMGYVSAKVSDPYKELTINVSTDLDVYKPRDTVKARIKVSQPHVFSSGSSTGNEPYEIAVAVVDESVLALNQSGRRYYDPYEGFNRLDPLDVNNYSLISRLIGRQKFEKKGANPGGDGGSYTQLRNQFKFVSYWNPSIKPDANGEASVEFTVPDNLTGWRILAFAVTPSDHMGLGDSNFKVNRPTEVRPVMPNQVIEGDQFQAGFNVMNRTDQPRDLKVKVQVKGPLAEDSADTFHLDLHLEPYKRENVWLPLKTKGFGELSFIASAGDQSDTDALAHKVPVNKRRSLETAATYGTLPSDSPGVSEAVQVPEGIYTDVGYIGAVLSPTVLGNLDGALQYIQGYPYLCWEQRLTKAVVARDYLELKDYLDKATQWPDAKGDVEQTLAAAANFQAPNGGMVYWVPSNNHVSPYLSAYTAIAFNWLRQSGYEIPQGVEDRLHGYLLNLLRRDDFPTFYSKGMSSSVRAVALAALSAAGKITANDIARYQTHVPEMDLFGKSHFLQAAIQTPKADPAAVSNTLNSILGQASQTGGKFQFNETWDDSYKYILATPLRSNCSILGSLLSAQVDSGLGDSIGDVPFKLVRSITQSRGNRDHWENTQENVFCLNALIDYAKIYERDTPTIKATVSFNQQPLGEAEFTAKTNPPVTLSRPIQGDDPGRATSIDIQKEGDGRLYYSARIAYDLKEDNASRINSGIEIRREYFVEREGKFVLLDSPMEIHRGELVKVNIFVAVPTARHFVVVNDPIPGGLEPVNTDLATASQVDGNKGAFTAAGGSWFYQFSDWTYYGGYFWSFYHKELRHDSARFYADYLPAGRYALSYTAQAIAEGDFTVMPIQAEEMYDPDVYGKGLPARLKVGP